MSALHRLFTLCSLFLLLPTIASSAAEPATAKKPKPAHFKIRGYNLLGDWELRRILKTVELGGKKPEFFTSSFVEDSAILLSSRIRRDGYLHPGMTIKLHLADGSNIVVQAQDLLENPLPPNLHIKNIQFQIHKGVLYHYASLTFDGLATVPEKKARAFFLETETLLHPKLGRIYTPERVEHGRSSLQDLLERQGYKDAKVEIVTPEPDRQTGAAHVHVRVRQGPKYIVRSVCEEFFYEGTNAPARTRTVTPNQPYSRFWVQDFSLGIKTNEYHLGYPDVTVDIRPESQIETYEINVIYLGLLAIIKPGPQIRVGDVQFGGEKITSRKLMARRIRIRRGDLLDPIRVEEGRFRLAQLGAFDSVDLRYQPHEPNVRDVFYQVKESKRLTVSLLAGYGSYELLRGGAEVEANNIWGMGHHARVKAVQSFKSTSGDFTYTIPEVLPRDVDLFLNANGLRRQEVSFTRVEYGGGVGLHKYFQPAATDATFRYNYQILSTIEAFPAVATEGLTNPAVGSFILDLKHDRRDNPLYPRKGYKVFATFEFASEYLGGDANYGRIEISPSWHLPLGGGRYLSLGLSQGAAISLGTPANNLPFNKRFFPGGEASIRGYGEGEASPRNAFGQLVGAETYTLGTVEFEQALTAKWALVIFSDSLGQAHHIENYPFDMGLFSIGIGIRWKTIIGPVRLEYGYNLNPRPDDPSGTVQFSIGYPF